MRLLVPDLPGDPSALIASERKAYPPHARLVALTPPGCGWSDPLALAGADLSAIAEVLAFAVTQLALSVFSVAGEGAGAVLADLLLRHTGSELEVELINPPAWLTGDAALPQTPLLRDALPAWDGSHLCSAWFQLRDLHLYDVPPAAGAAVRRPGSDAPDVARLDRLFRHYIQGPDCAALLAQVVEHVRDKGADRPFARTRRCPD